MNFRQLFPPNSRMLSFIFKNKKKTHTHTRTKTKIKSNTKLNQRRTHYKCLNRTENTQINTTIVSTTVIIMLLWFYIYCQLIFTLKITLKNEENEAKHDKTH